jgi:pimeloyl-ACP methyl ester carboxylesterase
MPATVVLVHGAWHGAWCWQKVVDGLAARGVPALAIDLPGHGDSREPLGDLYGDAAALRAVLDQVAERAGADGIVVCGHSYGGAVVSEGAAGHPAVRHLVFLAALMLAEGESAAQSVPEPAGGAPGPPSELGPAMRVSDDGAEATVDRDIARTVFYHDCSAADAERSVASLGAQPTASFQQPVRGASWRTIPSTYVVCEHDRALAVWMQEAFSARATDTVVWPTSHSPFVSRPELVVDLLAGLAQ